MGQIAHPGRRRGAACAVALGATVAASPLLSGCSTSGAAATTTLRGALSAVVVHADGSTVPGLDGLRLRRGDVVHTAPGGRAELVTGSRTVYVGSEAAVEVDDGAHQQLRTGAVVADAQHGSPLHLQVGGLDVFTPAGAAMRAERGVTTRVGALAGSTQVDSSIGRRLTVAALHQTTVGGDALPDVTAPLRLTDDDGEAHAVPDLVRDDQTLDNLARGIDETGGLTAHLVQAAWAGQLSAPPGVGRAERLLPAVIATAGPQPGLQQRYAAAVSYRKAGGSWGVVAHLVGVGASSVVDALAAFERRQPGSTSVAAVLAAAAGRTPAVAGRASTGLPGGVRSGQGGSGSAGSGGGGTGGGGGSGGGSPSPSPSPSGPVNTVVGTVDKTVGQVLSLLPTPVPTPTPTAAPLPLPVTVPVPIPQVTSLPGLPGSH